MRKTNKKLTLTTNTVRSLDASIAVVGGLASYPSAVSCQNTCNPWNCHFNTPNCPR
jgi:hypothetical protein